MITVPYDQYMTLPFMMTIFGSIVADVLARYRFGGFTQSLTTTLFPLIGGFIAFYVREHDNCTVIIPGETPNIINFYVIERAICDSIITQGFALLVSTIFYFTPVIGNILKIITYIPIIGTVLKYLIYGMFYIIIYICVNAFSGNDDPIDCSPSNSVESSRYGAAIFSIIMILIAFIKNIIF